jgi:hypothetical protein
VAIANGDNFGFYAPAAHRPANLAAGISRASMNSAAAADCHTRHIRESQRIGEPHHIL